jgi:hypothetical protein
VDKVDSCFRGYCLISFAFLFSEESISKINYTEERGVFENDEGHGLFLKTRGSVLIVVIVMGPGFSSLGGKKCIKNKSLEKARPHRYSIGGLVDKSFRVLLILSFHEITFFPCQQSS